MPTGGQPTPTAHGADLAATARALRIESATTVRTEQELRDALLQSAMCVVAKVAESTPTVKPPLDYVGIKQRFMTAIGNSE